MKNEPIPLFKEQEKVFAFGEHVVTILKVNTYCPAQDKFLDKATYSIKHDNGFIEQVNESDLSFITS